MDIGQCLTQYGFRMESHLLMNCTMAIDISIREMNSDALEIAQLTLKHHVKRYQEIFESLTGGNEEIAKKFASAWYYVTYADPIQPVGLDAPILSFPWIIKHRPAYPRDSNVSLQNLIAQDIKNWFNDEAISLIDILSQKLSLLNSLDGVLDDSKIQICLREFLLTGSIILCTSSNNLKVKILKAFPSAIIKPAEDSMIVTIDSTTFIFKSEVNERKSEFLSQAVYIKTYLLSKISGYKIEENFTERFEEFSCNLNELDGLVLIDEVPKALRTWHSWILKADDSVYTSISKGLIDTMDKMILEGLECKINILKLYFALLRTCRIKTVLSIVNNTNTVLKPSVVKIIAKNPRILRQIGHGINQMAPTGRGCYVQGAAKMIFIGSSGEGDLLKFEIYDGRRRIAHLMETCYKLSLKNPQLLADDAFAYNEFWTHLHGQFSYLRKFGGPEYGKLQVGVKLGQIYATEIPKMFMEQSVSIWITRVALDKAFKTSKFGRSKHKTNEENGRKPTPILEEINLDQLKFNPRSDACIDETISSNRVTQSLQSLLDSATNTAENNSEDNEKAKLTATTAATKKSSKAFGKMSTAFEAVVEEEVALKFLKMGQFTKETNLNVSLTCYDESTNTNTSLNLLYDEENRLKCVGQMGLRWAVADVLSPEDFSARVLITSQNTRAENLESTIFSNGIIERDQNGQMRVKEDFRSNQTIYARYQEGHSAVLRDDFTLIIRKITEAIGVDPATGLFAISQDKWEVEAKMVLDWDEIHDYQYRDQLILTLWSISRKLKRPF